MRVRAVKKEAYVVYNTPFEWHEFATITIYSFLPTRPYEGGVVVGPGLYLGGRPDLLVPYIVGYVVLVFASGPSEIYYLNHGEPSETPVFLQRDLLVGESQPTQIVAGLLSIDGKIEVPNHPIGETVPLTEDIPWYRQFFPSILVTGFLNPRYRLRGGGVRGAVFAGYDENIYISTSERM